MYRTTAQISLRVRVAPKGGMVWLRPMMYPPPHTASNSESSGRSLMYTGSECTVGRAGSASALGPSPFPVAPWQAAQYFPYTAAPSAPEPSRTSRTPGSGSGRVGGAARGDGPSTSSAEASPPRSARYRMTSVRQSSRMMTAGMTVVAIRARGWRTMESIWAWPRRAGASGWPT